MAVTPKPTGKPTEIIERKPTYSERFAAAVQRQFEGEVGNVNFTAYEKTLAQHMYIKIDAAMAEANTKIKDGQTPIGWENVNMAKLSIDAVNRVQLGIDALIPGNLYPIAYFNERTKKYDMDLRVGYRGELFYKQAASIKPIRNVRIELVYETDKFTVYKAGVHNKLEGYDFEITQAFNRGALIGGFGYIEYEDDKNNVLIVLSRAEIEVYHKTAKGEQFWSQWYEQMAYKTIVHRLMGKIIIDPAKINVTALYKADADDLRPTYDYEAPPALDNPAPLENPTEDETPAATPAPDDEEPPPYAT